MTRSVHPYPHPGNVESSSSSVAPAKAPSHPYEVMAMQQQQQRGVAPSFPAPAVPISVTTASHPDPGSSSSQKHNLQLSSGAITHNLQLASGGMPQKQLHVASAPAKMNYSAPPTLAGPRGGFTLPCSVQLSATAEARGLSTPSPIAPVKKSASAMPLMQGYSAASVASIHAQDAKSVNALGRRTQSAPNTVVLSKSKNQSKYKYRKVVGGKVLATSSTVSS